ncbi:MAG: hypothetical protein SWX82_10665 [Cyanobacteriota bacterium]|nr:hypothetical protein [Cyanobacteriota bacterium]
MGDVYLISSTPLLPYSPTPLLPYSQLYNNYSTGFDIKPLLKL